MKAGWMVFVLFVVGAISVVTTTAAGAPDLELLPGSTVTLGVAGAERPIDPQLVSLRSDATPGSSFASSSTIDFPTFNLAFGESVNIYQNQQLVGDLDPASGDATIEFPLWILDGDGNRTELMTVLTTGTPTTNDCTGNGFCSGGSVDPAYCDGSGWDPVTGDVRLVGVTLLPFGTGTSVDCSGIVFVIEANIAPGDGDADGVQDVLDRCPDLAGTQVDVDADGVGDGCDNCPSDFNPYQSDADANGSGNACDPVRVNFQPSAAVVPGGFTADSGQLFSAVAGYGWLDVSTLDTADREVLADQRLDTLVLTDPARDWEAQLPPGRFDVSVSVGDAALPQGPQTVLCEDDLAFDGVTTDAGQNLQTTAIGAWIVDGRLTIEAGGGSGTTAMNYVTAVESLDQPFTRRYVNFQPSAAPLPAGFELDSGAVYSPAVGHGWDAAVLTRDRNKIDDQILDTCVFSDTHRTWELDLPADYYYVRLAVGDSAYAQGPHFVSVEGETWIADQNTAKKEFVTVSGWVLVLDGSLSVAIGQPGSNTTLNYVSVASLARDEDGDGTPNLLDNCVAVSNPSQDDTDADGIGDACNENYDIDGDEWSDQTDNCADQFNPGQENQDGDFRGDVCDCDPTNGSVFAAAGEVEGLVISNNGLTILSWSNQGFSAGFGTVYDVATQSISDLLTDGSFAAATCLENDRNTAAALDNRVPASGDGFLYLIRAENTCGVGTYGSGTSTPDPRDALDVSGVCP